MRRTGGRERDTLSDVLLVEKKDHIALVTLNRPAVLNAFNMELANALRFALEKLEEDAKIRVIVLTGAGEKAFSTGADLKERAGLSLDGVKAQRKSLVTAFSAVARAQKPIIAAVNGYALGGGFELALLCDFIIAAERAKFGLPEVTRGVIPGAGGTQTLPRIIGKAAAKELILTGRIISAEEAEGMHLVVRVVPDAELLKEALRVAEVIAKNAPVAVVQAKKAIDYGTEVDLNTGLAFELATYDLCLHTEDFREGINAFHQKRLPNFQGK